jgi:hypothetical protein
MIQRFKFPFRRMNQTGRLERVYVGGRDRGPEKDQRRVAPVA